jgi:hypothetical protein
MVASACGVSFRAMSLRSDHADRRAVSAGLPSYTSKGPTANAPLRPERIRLRETDQLHPARLVRLTQLASVRERLCSA